MQKNLAFIPEYGTWKDLSYLMGTTFENDALDLFAGQLQEGKRIDMLHDTPDIKLLQKILSEKENANTSKEGKEEEKKTELVDIKKGSGISLAAKWVFIYYSNRFAKCTRLPRRDTNKIPLLRWQRN